LKKLKLEDLYKYSAVGDLHIFPDGENFVFVRRTMDKKENQYESNIWSGNMKNGEVRQLTGAGRTVLPSSVQTARAYSLSLEETRTLKDPGFIFCLLRAAKAD